MNVPSSVSAPRVLVPRPARRGEGLARLLRADGLDPVLAPLVSLEAFPSGSSQATALAEAVQGLTAGEFALLVVTSPAGAEALAAQMGSAPAGTRAAGTRVVAVGHGTADALRAAGLEVDLVAGGSGTALVEAVPAAPDGGARVLLPVSAAAAPTVPQGLSDKGYTVRRVDAYRPVPLAPAPEVREDLHRGRIAAMVLTSSMIARRAAALEPASSTRVVAIGTPTARAAREAGLEVHAVAVRPDDAGLARAVADVLRP